MQQDNLCIFGEVLFDHFPDGSRVLGGAPFNVAWHLQAFGLAPRLISRVGQDAEGEQVRAAMQSWGMDTSGLQNDPDLPTGRVAVSLVNGEPQYEIVRPVAWDRIDPPASAATCGLLYHGSLALREPGSRRTLEHLHGNNPDIVFMDVNLRPPWWNREQVLADVGNADWVKLNTDELALLHPATADGEQQAGRFLARHGLQGLIVTHGDKGAEIVTAGNGCTRVPSTPAVSVVDTVGAGDAFSAVIILGLSLEWPTESMLARALDFAAAIVGRRGATIPERDFYDSFRERWQLG